MGLAGAQILSVEEEEDSMVLEQEIFYGDVPREEKAEKEDHRVEMVREWHRTLKRPENFTDSEYMSFMRYMMEFVLNKGRLWRKHSQRAHQLVIPKKRRLNILREIHNKIGHKIFYLMREIITQQFWWPHIKANIIWYLCTCHICQKQQTRK